MERGKNLSKANRTNLRNRLYDYGFSEHPMSGVSRPRDRDKNRRHAKNLVARLFSRNNKLITEDKQPQTSLLRSKARALKENPDLVKRAMRLQMEFGCTNPISMGIGVAQENQMPRLGSQSSVGSGRSDPNKEMSYDRQITNESLMSGFKKSTGNAKNRRVRLPKLRTRARASNVLKQINEEEEGITKQMINKLRDKYLEKTRPYRKKATIPGESTRVRNQKVQLSPIRVDNKPSSKSRLDTPLQISKKQKAKEQRKSELNTYIKYLLTKENEVDKFVYLVPAAKSEDPYDLELKPYFKIFEEDDRRKGGVNSKKKAGRAAKIKMQSKSHKSKKEYYTISVKGLCHFKDGQPVEFIALEDWLKERETYYKIKNLQFFTKFRKWKTVLTWLKSCKNLKQQVARNSLKEKLFFNYPELKKACFEVKKMFYNLSQTKFVNLNYSKETSQEIGTIRKFVENQGLIAKKVHLQIKNISTQCNNKVIRAFENRLNLLRNEICSKEDTETGKKMEKNMILRPNNNPYENLNFPDNLTYDKRSELHKECHRFIRFSKLVDFLALNCLRTIHLNSLYYFREELKALNERESVTPLRLNPMSKFGNSKKKEPLFLVQLVLNTDYSALEAELEVEEIKVRDFQFPKVEEQDKDLRKLQYKEYNLITYPVLIDYDEAEQRENFNEQQKRLLEYADDREPTQITIPNIERVCLNYSPSADTFIQLISKMIMEGIQSLHSFESLSQHHTMKDYKAVLDDWDEGVEREAGSGKALLSPEEWIDQDDKNKLLNDINKQFESAFIKSNSFLKKFRQFLQIDFDYESLNPDYLLDANLAKPAMTFSAVYNLLDFHEFLFQDAVPSQEDIGLLRIDSRQVKEYLLPRPREVKTKLSQLIPKELARRLEECREWLLQNMEVLKVKTTNIDVFVSQSQKLKVIEKGFPFIKDRLKTCREIRESLKRFNISDLGEVLILFNKTKELEHELDSEIMASNKSTAEKRTSFSKDIKERLIPGLSKDSLGLEEKIANQRFIDHTQDQHLIIAELQEFELQLKELKERKAKLNCYEEVLNLPRSRFSNIGSLSEDLHTRLLLWEASRDWEQHLNTWKKTEFLSIDVDSVQKVAEQFARHVAKCKKRIPITNTKLQRLDRWIKDFSSILPVIIALSNSLLQGHHRKEINEIVGFEMDSGEMLLEDLLCEAVLAKQREIIEVSVQVTQEAGLKFILTQIETKIASLTFPLKSFKEDNSKDSTFILKDSTDLAADIDKLIMSINTVYGSRYLKELKKVATDKRKDILLLQDTLNEWVKFQKNYVYLESIFSQQEMKKSLTAEVKDFEENVNKLYKQNIKRIYGAQTIANALKQKFVEQLYNSFRKQNGILNELNKKINNFLDSKRENFPRFYFIYNDELIYILANYDSPEAVQTFVGKLFENVDKVDFGTDPKSTSIFGIISREGEAVPLKSSLNIKSDSVDKWMKKLEDLISESLYKAIRDGNMNYNTMERGQWFMNSYSQVASAVTQIVWTETTENYLLQMTQNQRSNTNHMVEEISEDEEDSFEMQNCLSDYKKNLEILTGLVRGQLEYAKHKTIVGLITSEVHNRDVLEMLQKEEIADVNHFSWQRQLRYYFNDITDWRNSFIIRQINAIEKYGFEYYGPCSRIVQTPLTDRCWITITSALRMKLGAAPMGPAGTGKTESTKDLAKSLGRFCLVFNCSEQIEFPIMEKLFRGIIQQGAWTCLDEFNRIGIEVLSVIAQQLLEMRLARLSCKSGDKFDFYGKKCQLNENCGVFTTMNPGYAGRSSLPDNLKALFRPISMIIPEYVLISTVLLFSEGFNNSKILAAKMIKLFRLSSEQLSQQDHYDFGMRAVKAVLVMAGKLKRRFPNEDENLLLIQALRDSNVPKFLNSDLKLFNALVSDLFPDIELPESREFDLRQTIQMDLMENNLQPKPKIIDKICQLKDTLNVRFGVFLLGDSMVGKTTSLKSLQRSLNKITVKEAGLNRQGSKKMDEELEGEKVDQNLATITLTELSPKSVTMGELFGFENQLTQDWQDGIASFYIRKAADDAGPTQKWISFDGPVDSLWIENLNSVLDDSRILCLSNGQRIRLNENIRILFEVDNLAQASLATISRCGMVYFSRDTMGWNAILDSWRDKMRTLKDSEDQPLLSNDLMAIVSNLCDSLLPPLVSLFLKMPKVVPVSEFQAVRTFCDLFGALIQENRGFTPKAPVEFKSQYLTLAFIFSAAWSFGGCLLDVEGKRPADRIDALIKKKFTTVEFPTEPILNCYIDTENTILRPFNDLLETEPGESKGNSDEIASPVSVEKKPNTRFWEILVSTSDTMKVSNVCEMLIEAERHIFVVGGSGAGKSVVANRLLKELSVRSNVDSLRFFFSAQTDAGSVYETVLDRLFYHSQFLRGADSGRKKVILVDDVNMPEKQESGAQPPLEILRQIMDKHMLFEKKEMWEIKIQDTLLFALAAPPSGGRHPIGPRFAGHFGTVAFPLPNSQTVQRIFSTILDEHLLDFEDIVRNLSSDLVQASVEFYEKIIAEKLPVPSKFHYTFNLRDLSKVFMGLTRADGDSYREQKDLIALWSHEMTRVFHDRLNDQEDRDWFFKTLEHTIEKGFKMRPDEITPRELFFSDIHSLQQDKRYYEPVHFDAKLMSVLEGSAIDYNDASSNKMELVFFEDAIRHLLRLLRILSQSRGNGLLIGVGGLGKQSLTRLAAFMLDQESISYKGGNRFDNVKFREWLRKEVLLKCAGPAAGKTGVPTCLLVAESIISSDTMLEYVSNLLNSGEVPNIFPPDEKAKLLKDLCELYGNLDEEARWDRFVARVRDNLHVMLCMSPVGPKLASRCRQFPALIDCCSLNWFDDWDSDAVGSVALRMLEAKQVPQPDEVAALLKHVHSAAVSNAEDFMQQTGRKCFVTPKTALDNVDLVEKLYFARLEKIKTAREVLDRGSEKLEETSVMVERLKIELKDAQPKLEEKKTLTEKKMVELEKATKVSQEKRAIVEAERQKKQVLTEQIEVINTEAMQQLSAVKPVLEKTEKDVRNIKDKDIVKLKHIKTPPALIDFIVANVCLALGEKYVDWLTSGVKLLSNPKNFLNSLIDRIEEIKLKGAKAIPEQTMRVLSKNLKSEYFSKAKLEKDSFAGPLGMWVRAIHTFANLKKNIEPLERNAREMSQKLQVAKGEYDKIMEEANVCKRHMNALQVDYTEITNQKQELETTIHKTQEKLVRAEKLTTLLVDENQRWKESIANYDNQLTVLLVDALMSAAMVSYFGPLDGVYRERLLKEIDILTDRYEVLKKPPTFDFIKVMGDPLEIKKWEQKGLPSDPQSQTSALIATKSVKWPLMIDPQKQAASWLKNLYKERKDFVVLKDNMDETHKMTKMRMALSNGYIVLLENVRETLDAGLDSVFQRLWYHNPIDQRVLLSFNGETVDFHSDFKLFLTSKISSPDFLPDIFIKMNVINFTVTPEGLEEQLLAEVVKIEKPSVERQKNEIIEKLSTYKKKLISFEEQILRLLADSSATFIEDEHLVTTLQSSKTTSREIKEKVANSERLAIQIERTRNEFRPVAARGSVLFFVVTDVGRIDPMYQYSLQYIIKIYKWAIHATPPSENIPERLNGLVRETSKAIFTNVSRGLFERHKLIFSFLMTARVGLRSGNVSPTCWELFLRGPGVVDKSLQPRNPCPDLLTEKAWDMIFMLSQSSPRYSGICQSFYERRDKWRRAMKQPCLLNVDLSDILSLKSSTDKSLLTSFGSPQKEAPPGSQFAIDSGSSKKNKKTDSRFQSPNIKTSLAGHNVEEIENLEDSSNKQSDDDLGLFEKLLLTQALTPGKLLRSISKYVQKTLGTDFLQTESEEAEEAGEGLESLVRSTDPETPIVFVLTQGADPSGIIKDLGDRMGFQMYDRLLTISLGKGQGQRAEKLIRKGVREGLWILLENCHLAKSWLPHLERIVEELQNGEFPNVNSDFRLFLTSITADYFPVSILQNGVKITTEPPKGLKKNILRSLNSVNDDYFVRQTQTTEASHSKKSEHERSGTEETTSDRIAQRATMRKSTHGKKINREEFLRTAKARLVTSLAFFHAILQERKNFGAIGWNKPYDFNDSDYNAGKDIILMMLSDVQNRKDVPWDSLFFLTGDVTYGGRVTDDQDRRLLLCLLKKFFTEQILDERYRFVADERYKIPRVSCKADIFDYVASIPDEEAPEILGLHPNATINFEAQEISRILDTLVDITSGNSIKREIAKSCQELENEDQTDGVAEKPEKRIKSAKVDPTISSKNKTDALISQIKEKIPSLIDIDRGHPDLFETQKNGLVPPLTTVLLQEIARFNNLIKNIHIMLESLSRALIGELIMTAELEEALRSLTNNRVPIVWKRIAYPSLKPLASWIDDLCLRVNFISYWLLHGKVAHFWLPGFFFPQGFLTGVLQTHARGLNMPIDRFSFIFKISEQMPNLFFRDFDSVNFNSNSQGGNNSRGKKTLSRNATRNHNGRRKKQRNKHEMKLKRKDTSTGTLDGVMISGLFLEGANWDKRRKLLVEQTPSIMHYPMPLIHFLPSEKTENKGNWYSCPLYKTLDRRGNMTSTGHSDNFVLNIALPCDKNKDLWVLRSVGLFCQTND